MPTITIRLSKDEKAALEAAYAEWAEPGQTVSDYVRETLNLRRNDDAISGLNTRVDDMWVRLARLEELAGLG